jgi:pilus assembly protein CpaB
MNRKIQLVIALVLGIAAVVLINLYLRQMKQSITRGMEMVKVLSAQDSIPPNTKLTEDLLKTELIPERYVHKNALTPRDLDLVLGQVTRYRIEKNSPLLWSDLGVTQSGVALSEIVREKERAITIPVDEASSVGNLIRPNDAVDILGTFSTETGGEGTGIATITLLQNVTILAVGDRFGTAAAEPNVGYRTVTLSVTPLEAEILVFAQERGKLSLALRNNRDLASEGEIPKITWEDIYKVERRATIQRERDVRVIKGRER